MKMEITARRSIRKYKPDKPVAREQLKQLLSAAMLAPSACNSRPWEFIAVTKREVLDEIARVHPYAKMCATATAAIVIVAQPKSGKPEGFYPQDCAAAAQNILLEAVGMGLGTCWCGVYPKPELMEIFGGLFNIHSPKVVFCVIAIGTPDESPPQKGKYEEDKVTFVE